MIKKIENCLYCGEKMESKTAKKKFCSDKCRIYYGREVARGTLALPKIGEPILSGEVTTRKQHNHSLTLTVKPQSEEIPRLKGETSIEYRLRIMELKEANAKI